MVGEEKALLLEVGTVPVLEGRATLRVEVGVSLLLEVQA